MNQQFKTAFIFPGQGAQYSGMAKDFYNEYSIARQTFEEAEEILGRKLLTIIFDGPDALLNETKNSQLSIYVMSCAILRVIHSLYPTLQPHAVAGLSLGEYSALTASKRLPFAQGVRLVNYRAQFMNDACEVLRGTMAVVLGLTAKEVESIVSEMDLPEDLWVANYNCPGQVVISGTLKGIEHATVVLKAKGAKRVLPLAVHGAFHSKLMSPAKEFLKPYLEQVDLQESDCQLFMNVPGDAVNDLLQIRQHLIEQVTESVRWEQSIRQMKRAGIEIFIEVGCGKTLAGFNKRIDETMKTVSVEKTTDLHLLEGLLLEGLS